jgi:hypothetical protein
MKTNSMNRLFSGVLLIAFVFLGSPAQAEFITVNSFASPTVIDFSDQPARQAVYGPVQIGTLVGMDVTVESSSSSNGLYFNFSAWGLGLNGGWGIPRTYVSLNDSADSMIFAFNDGPVSGVGGLMNYARGTGHIDGTITLDLVISALDSSMGILESYNVTALADIITNDGAFRGIQRSSADIFFFQVSGGNANALDDLTFVTAPVPEPSGLLLFGMGLAGLVATRARRRRA